MKKQLLLIIFLTSVSNFSYAGTINGHFSCGTVIDWDKNDNKIGKEMVVSWFDGFFSGINWESDITLNPPDSNSTFYAIVKYCKDNPLKHSANASVYVYQKLKN